jgi:diguanylate cyclase (GGDEF)-like protein/PAS domain S-box-containing protein
MTDSFEDLYQRAACGQLSTDPDDDLTTVNETFLRWSGYDREALIGKPFHTFLTPSSQLFYETRYQPVLRLNGEIREVALSLVCADGSILPILLNAVIVTDAAGQPAEVRTAIFDSTVRQDYERDLLAARRLAEVSETNLRVLQDASTLFLTSDSEESLAVALVEAARDAFAAADAAVVYFDRSGEMRVAAGDHLRKTMVDLRAAEPTDSQIGPSEIITVTSLDDAASHSPRTAEILHEARFEALSAVSLFDGETLLGALVCFYGRSREFDRSTLELHDALARQAALVLVRVRLQLELQQLAMHDQLTGLANRNLLRERLSHAISSAERSSLPMSLLFLDLDGFKHINDQLGHRAGDAVLQVVAARLDSIVRAADIVGRFGGDEFLVICENADEDAAGHIAHRITAVVRDRIDALPPDYGVTASVGVATYHPGLTAAPTNDSLVRAADAAMYVSKNSGADKATIVRV